MAQKKPGKVLFQGIEAGMKVFRWMVLVLVILFMVSGLAKVQPTHIGILTRFGKLVPVGPGNNIHEPGFVLAFPYPIDQLIQIPKDLECSNHGALKIKSGYWSDARLRSASVRGLPCRGRGSRS